MAVFLVRFVGGRMKKVLIYLLLSFLAILIFPIINIVLGVGIDFLNLLLNKSIFSWFYATYGIVWKWDFWHYCIVTIISLIITTNLLSKIINKLKKKELL